MSAPEERAREPEAALEPIEQEALEPQAPAAPALKLHWKNSPGMFYRAAEAVDIHKKLSGRRTFYLVAVGLVILFFLPEIRTNSFHLGVGSIIMVLLAVAAVFAIVWYPGYLNRKFAREKTANCPETDFSLTAEGFHLREGQYDGYTEFAEEVKCAAIEFEGVIALSYCKNRVSAIPLCDLLPDQRELLRELLREGLGDRFEKAVRKGRR